MLRGRLSFGNDTPAPFPSALILWGASAAQRDATRREFPTDCGGAPWHFLTGAKRLAAAEVFG
jgi:hypothetical protein